VFQRRGLRLLQIVNDCPGARRAKRFVFQPKTLQGAYLEWRNKSERAAPISNDNLAAESGASPAASTLCRSTQLCRHQRFTRGEPRQFLNDGQWCVVALELGGRELARL